jgi:hypothetical protein
MVSICLVFVLIVVIFEGQKIRMHEMPNAVIDILEVV